MLGEEARAVSVLAQHDNGAALLEGDLLRFAHVHRHTQPVRSRHTSQHVHAGVHIACGCCEGCASSFNMCAKCAMRCWPQKQLELSSLAQELLRMAVIHHDDATCSKLLRTIDCEPRFITNEHIQLM